MTSPAFSRRRPSERTVTTTSRRPDGFALRGAPSGAPRSFQADVPLYSGSTTTAREPASARTCTCGTIAPQTLGVTLDKASTKLSSAAGTTVQVALGAAGQTVRIDAEGCQSSPAPRP